jgi:hypothetical protein
MYFKAVCNILNFRDSKYDMNVKVTIRTLFRAVSCKLTDVTDKLTASVINAVIIVVVIIIIISLMMEAEKLLKCRSICMGLHRSTSQIHLHTRRRENLLSHMIRVHVRQTWNQAHNVASQVSLDLCCEERV